MRGLTGIAETVAYDDPQAGYSKLRAEWGEIAPVELEPGINAWLVMGYAELVQVLRDERTFARSTGHWRDYSEGRIRPESALAPMMFPRPNALFADGDEHRRLREPINDLGKNIPSIRAARLTREVCGSLIADFAGRGQADLVGEYALMIPTLVIGRILGLGPETARDLFNAQMAMVASGEASHEGNQRFEGILSDLVHARRDEPANDFTTAVVRHPNFQDHSERLHTMTMIIAAAGVCSMAWIASTLRLMLMDPRFAARVRGGVLGLDEALEEVLWRDPPMANFPARYARHDTVLARRHIGKGDALILAFAAANADPRVHGDDPWNELGNRAHLAWGAGPHVCPAQPLGRVIVRTSVETALHRLPGLRLGEMTAPPGRATPPWTRCPDSLPVTFRAPGTTPAAKRE